MGAKYSGGVPDVVVVGSASRDVAADDPRGWRLGGGVSYTALTTARLGLATAALVGVDDLAAEADELDLLRRAGVDVSLVRLARGPVFENIERPGGRVQNCVEVSDPIPPAAVPDAWRSANGWILTPVAAEIPPEWSAVPPDPAIVAVGWQGFLRVLAAGAQVRHLRPRPSAVVGRADLVGVSRDDLDHRIRLATLSALLRPGATLAVTQGDRGGLVMEAGPGGPRSLRHYPAVRTHGAVDPTGAGDVFLAALAAARIQPRLVGGRLAGGLDLLLAAAAASLVLEGPGLRGVPDRAAVARRMAEGAEARRRPSG
jgi:sugar/nucleoside kinase (ribokinase family)